MGRLLGKNVMGYFSGLSDGRVRSPLMEVKGLDVRRKEVKSSNIKSIGYDQRSRLLVIEFLSGSVYEYYNVPQEIYAE